MLVETDGGRGWDKQRRPEEVSAVIWARGECA